MRAFLVALAAVLLLSSTASAAGTVDVSESRPHSCVTDSAGYCPVPHSLGVEPSYVQVTPRIPKGYKSYILSVVMDSETAAEFKVRAVFHDGKPKAGNTIWFYFEARGEKAADPEPVPDPVEPDPTPDPTPSPDPAPTPTAGAVCGTNSLDGPTSAPAGAVVVPAGDNSAVDFRQANTTYYFEAGVHTLGGAWYSQIIPANGSTFVGAPGAILDGKSVNQYAFTGQATGVTVKYLTVRNFEAPFDEGVVNHDSGDNWTVERNTLIDNHGGALMAGDGNRIVGNCLKDNGQYGLNAYQGDADGPTDLLLEGNEFVGNATDPEPSANCGCSGGMKFWSVDTADVRGNWIHHNHGTGLWADNNNNDFLITDNLIEDNEGHGIFYEQSYNGKIVNNTIRRNAWETGREFASRGDNFPIGAIYVSEAGGDFRIPARYTTLEITGNVFEDNWGGVALWENADRFCNSPANTGSDCTLPMGGTTKRNAECSQPGIASEPLYTDCRWRTRNVDIHHNTFRSDSAKIDGGCPTNYCGVQAVFSNWGSYPDWSPYKARVIQEAITFEQGNKWHDNTYTGSWKFVPYETGNLKSWDAWRAAPYSQDVNSTLN